MLLAPDGGAVNRYMPRARSFAMADAVYRFMPTEGSTLTV
jgi:hypothetical protein